MSIAALDWAFKQPIEQSSLKFVLVALANYAGADGTCYPSAIRLSFDTGQDDKTVRRNLRELAKLNFIQDTGRRAGRTKQIPVFILTPYANLPENGSLSGEGTQKRIERYPKTDLKGTRKRVTEPAIDPLVEHKKADDSRKSEEQRQRNLAHLNELIGGVMK